MRVAVVGAGICGLSATHELSQSGHQVTLFEQHPLGHDLGSSHGASRIVRKAYPDALYTEYMLQAYPLWAELDAKAGGGILHECGLLYYGGADSANVVSLIGSLTELKVTHEVLDAQKVTTRMPDLRLDEDEVGVFTPEAGWVAADRALQALWSLAQKAGAKLRPQRVEDLEQLEKGYDSIIVCAGPWVRNFVDVAVTTTLQTYAYLERRQSGPVWIEDGFDGIYGFPSEPARDGIKIGVHSLGEEIDPDDEDRTPNPYALDKIRAIGHRRFGITHPRLNNAKGCIYTSTRNEDFILGRVGEKSYFASACSGHGFKFGLWIGRLLARFVDGKDVPENYPRFLHPQHR
jgi:sarcosine oxidase